MLSAIKRIYPYRYALWDMAVKRLKVKYTGARLGIWWAVINPLLVMLAVTFVFVGVFKIEIINFPLFALAGIFPWLFFSGALSESTNSILAQQNILRQFNLPCEIIPLSSILADFLNFLIGWVIIYPVFLWFKPAVIRLMPFLAIVILLQLLFTCGLGVFLSAANVFLRDIAQLLSVLLMLWFWVTPVFYSQEMVPQPFVWLFGLNPMAPYIIFFRDILYLGKAPGILTFIGVFFWAFISITFGWYMFLRLEPKLLKRI